MVFTGVNINRAWKDDNTWFGEYVGTYVAATLRRCTNEEAHAVGRRVAETEDFYQELQNLKLHLIKVLTILIY